MNLKTLTGAMLIGAVLAAPAAARDLSFSIDPNNAADRADMLYAIRDAARQACAVTGSRIVNRKCFDDQVAEMIASVKSESLRVALMTESNIDRAGHTATAQSQ